MIPLWDVDSGLSQIDKYLHSNDNHVVAGALLGVGIVYCGINNDCDPVLSLSLSFYLSIYSENDLIIISLLLKLSRHWLCLLIFWIERIPPSELGQS